MKHLLKFGMILLTLTFVASCHTSEKKKIKTIENELNKQVYSYAIDTKGVSVGWTAYKFTNKVGVSGKFDNFKLSVVNDAKSIEGLLKQSKIAIYTASVNSNSEIRDPKLRVSFFKVFNTDTIKGNILKANNSKGLLNLEMNNITNPLEYSYSIENDTLFLSATIDLEKWKGKSAMQSLNKVCYDLHKGADGISKLWPDVDVTIKLPFKKTLLTD